MGHITHVAHVKIRILEGKGQGQYYIMHISLELLCDVKKRRLTRTSDHQHSFGTQDLIKWEMNASALVRVINAEYNLRNVAITAVCNLVCECHMMEGQNPYSCPGRKNDGAMRPYQVKGIFFNIQYSIYNDKSKVCVLFLFKP